MTAAQAEAASIDVGLRQYMLRVYNYMASGLALTGLVAYAAANYANSDPAIKQLLYVSPLKWVIMLAPVAIVFLFAARIQAMSFGTAQAVFWGYAALMGLSLSSIFLVFTGESIARVFFITAGTFAGMSLWGYATKRDLTNFGGFLFMGLIGIVLASLVNMFIGSSALQFAISVIGVLVFVGLTAYDTQRIKEQYSELYDDGTLGKLAIMGALALYLDFINLFVMLLQLFGSQRE
ncbi:MAG: Bax inhibitor-1/YccA family protein [Proteobacteria bacterium]|nr:Bax inhibitor-1/YccA family protein [Pseudomonadota bacterium]MBI3497785.1 Bax inhibitor-1/YccA family protein [Pseudomonadota bacterium]